MFTACPLMRTSRAFRYFGPISDWPWTSLGKCLLRRCGWLSSLAGAPVGLLAMVRWSGSAFRSGLMLV